MENLHKMLMRTDSAIIKRIHSEAAAIGLTPGQPKILEFLYPDLEADQKTIALNCLIEQATVGSILSHMEKKGLIERFRKEGNRRSLYVKLTKEGKNKAEEMLKVFSKVDDDASGLLNAKEKSELLVLLKKVLDGVRNGNTEN